MRMQEFHYVALLDFPNVCRLKGSDSVTDIDHFVKDTYYTRFFYYVGS